MPFSVSFRSVIQFWLISTDALFSAGGAAVPDVVLFIAAVDVVVNPPAAWRGWWPRGLAGDTTSPPTGLTPVGAGRCCATSTS